MVLLPVEVASERQELRDPAGVHAAAVRLQREYKIQILINIALFTFLGKMLCSRPIGGSRWTLG